MALVVLQVVLVGLAGLTLYYLKRYTDETVKLRKVAQDQVEATLMPIVVLTRAEDGSKFFVKNTGKGPAFNVEIDSFSAGRLPKSSFHQCSMIAPGEQNEVLFRIDSKPYGPREFVTFVRQGYPDQTFPTTIHYQGVTKSYRYQTSQTFKFTLGKYDLVIGFDGFERFDRHPE